MIIQYNQYENNAIKNLSPYVVREFHPVTFNRFGFQTNITCLSELWKFSDSMQEFRFEKNLILLNGGLSQIEFNQLKFITERVVSFSQNMGHLVTGRNSLTRSFLSLRALLKIKDNLKLKDGEMKVLEIGPGSGYLGVLCRLNGIKYHSTEVTQSFYLHQHYLWKHILDNESLYECFEDQIPDKDFVHIPWWTWANYNIPLPKYNAIVINHAVNEISTKGFAFLMQRTNETHNEGFLLVENWGGGRFITNINIILRNGGLFLHQKFSPNKNYIPISILMFKKKEFSIKFNQILFCIYSDYLKKFFPLSLKFFVHNFIKFKINYKYHKLYTREVITVFSKILKQANPEISINSINDYYSNLVGNASLHTEDELFGLYINSEDHSSIS